MKKIFFMSMMTFGVGNACGASSSSSEKKEEVASVATERGEGVAQDPIQKMAAIPGMRRVLVKHVNNEAEYKALAPSSFKFMPIIKN